MKSVSGLLNYELKKKDSFKKYVNKTFSVPAGARWQADIFCSFFHPPCTHATNMVLEGFSWSLDIQNIWFWAHYKMYMQKLILLVRLKRADKTLPLVNQFEARLEAIYNCELLWSIVRLKGFFLISNRWTQIASYIIVAEYSKYLLPKHSEFYYLDWESKFISLQANEKFLYMSWAKQ